MTTILTQPVKDIEHMVSVLKDALTTVMRDAIEHEAFNEVECIVRSAARFAALEVK
jgi:hypothetical protein